MADIAASLLAKIKNKSRQTGKPYQLCLQLFFQEEFLRRLAGSKYTGNFILKGGLLIYTLTNFESRPTVDIDFLLHHMENDPDHMDQVLADILATPTGHNDVVILTANKVTPISLHREYPGVSAQLIGHIKNVRVPFDVDIGVGDVIVPKHKSVSFSRSLRDLTHRKSWHIRWKARLPKSWMPFSSALSSRDV